MNVAACPRGTLRVAVLGAAFLFACATEDGTIDPSSGTSEDAASPTAPDTTATGGGRSGGGSVEPGEPDAGPVEPCPTTSASCSTLGAIQCLGDGSKRVCELDLEGCATWSAAGSCEDGDACTDDDCDEDGGCTHAPKGCGDDNVCNGLESCDPLAGCLPGADLVCSDGLACTGQETCHPALGCVHGDPPAGCCSSDADCKTGDPCTSVGFCELGTGTCKIATALSCNDGNACNGVEVCLPGVGCVSGDPLVCDDKNICNGQELCDLAVGCVSTPVLACNDGLPCNGIEVCDPLIGCVGGEPLPGCCGSKADCEDGNICNGLGSCDIETGVCGVEAPTPCDDGNICNGHETCDALEGCVGGKVIDCNDGNPCNGAELCDVEVGCLPGTPKACDDNNACNGLETCDPIFGCQNSEAPACSDGNACNGLETCEPGKGCALGLVPTCNDDNPCTQDACDPAKGCVFDAAPINGSPCEDGSVCTTGDACESGQCLGLGKVCDDNNACTVDTCQEGAGCVHEVAEGACDDSNPCTTDSCNGVTGQCENIPNIFPCDDGSVCTVADQCADSICQGLVIDCTDENPCSDDKCDAEEGCFYPPVAKPCDDADACTLLDFCQDGACEGLSPVDCDDDEACTDDGCDAISGECTHVANTQPCDDSDACTTSDACAEGTCQSGEATLCNDNLYCTLDACDAQTGECVYEVGTGCLIEGLCVPAGTPSPADPCLQCLPAVDEGGWSPADGLACDDGDDCTWADTCEGGGCAGTGYTCDDDNDCTDDLCTGEGDCDHPVKGGSCVIEGACVEVATSHPADPCFACIPSASQSGWSEADGAPCGALPGAASTVCTGGVCVAEVCEEGRGDCDGIAANGCETEVSANASHCGACGKACEEGQVCGGGSCGSECPEGLEICSGACVDLDTDASHCSECDLACTSGDPGLVGSCADGTCSESACPTDTWDVDGLPGNGCEYACTPSGAEACDGLDNDCDGEADEDFDLDDNPVHCGACGEVCSHPSVVAFACVEGGCEVVSCALDKKDANGLASDGCEAAFEPGGELWVDAFNPLDPFADGTPSHPFDSLADAVAAAFPGYTIHLEEGAYTGNLVLAHEGLTIAGEGRDLVVVTTLAGDTGLRVEADGVTIRDVAFNGGDEAIWFAGTAEDPVEDGLVERVRFSETHGLKPPVQKTKGETASSILLTDALGVVIDDAEFASIKGGDGTEPADGYQDSPGGGTAAAIRITASSGVQVRDITIEEVTGGKGGKASFGGKRGVGGWGFAVRISDSEDITFDGVDLRGVHQGAQGDDASYAESTGPGDSYGFHITGSESIVLRHVLITEVGDACLRVESSSAVLIANLTCHAPGVATPGAGHGLWAIDGMLGSATVIDSIVTGGAGWGFKNDNDLSALLLAAYSDVWGFAAGRETGAQLNSTTLDFDPLYVDAEAGDLHLQPDSPCLDGGKPESTYCEEPAPNGCSANLGAYGDSAEATSNPLALHCPCEP